MRDYTPSDLCDELGPDAEPQWLDHTNGYGAVPPSPFYRKQHRFGLSLAAIALGFVVACIVVALGVL